MVSEGCIRIPSAPTTQGKDLLGSWYSVLNPRQRGGSSKDATGWQDKGAFLAIPAASYAYLSVAEGARLNKSEHSEFLADIDKMQQSRGRYRVSR